MARETAGSLGRSPRPLVSVSVLEGAHMYTRMFTSTRATTKSDLKKGISPYLAKLCDMLSHEALVLISSTTMANTILITKQSFVVVGLTR